MVLPLTNLDSSSPATWVARATSATSSTCAWCNSRVDEVQQTPLRNVAGDLCPARNETVMRLSIRNQLSGTIVEVTLGTVMATVKVRLDGGEQVVTASITKDAAIDLQLAEGQPATVLIKSTEVAVGVE